MADFLNRYPHMVQEHYSKKVRRIMQERRERLGAIGNRAEAEAYVKQIREKLTKVLPLPEERTPLNVKNCGIIEEDELTIEKITYESRPKFQVSATLYRPRHIAGKAPAVLGVCGHALDGKGNTGYQSFCRNLAAKGFIALIIDPISQGERWQHDEAVNNPGPALCAAHNLMGNQQILCGDNFASWRLWDAIRGLDYLCSLPEVDQNCLGVTGNSGGGTMTTLVAAIDPRPTMVAPSCYICSWQANMDNELPIDAEQNLQGALAAGLDHADLLLAYPRHTMVLSQKHDFFDERYARQSCDEIKRIHKLLESPYQVEYFMGPTIHGYSQESREAMVDFFMRQAGISGSAAEENITPLPAEELFCTPTGNVNAAGSRRVFDFIKDMAAEQRQARCNLSAHELRDCAYTLLNIPQERPPASYSCLRNLFTFTRWESEKARTQFVVETEPGIKVLITSFGVEHSLVHFPEGKVRLYIGNTSGERDVSEIEEIKQLAQDGKIPLLATDPRGIGQSQAACCDMKEFFAPYSSDYFYASYGFMLNESYLGRRVFDILQVMDLLLTQNISEIELIGRGLGSITAAFAALLHPSQPAVTLFNYLPSYQTLIESQCYKWPLSGMVPGIMPHFDLPEVYTALGDRLTTKQPWNEMME